MDYNKWMIAALLICGLINSGFAKPSNTTQQEETGQYDEANYPDLQGDDDYEYDDEDRNDNEKNPIVDNDTTSILGDPYFADTQRRQEIINPGDTIILFCDVRNLHPNNMILWYNGSRVILQGKFSFNDRVSQLDLKSVQIKDFGRSDANQYGCQVLPQNIWQNTTVEVAQPPKVVILHEGREVTQLALTFREGERAEFECKAFGVEFVTYKWSRKGERLQNHDARRIEDNKIILERLSWHDDGIYQCLGDDNSEQPPHGSVTVIVHYAPKVSTHRHFVNTAKADKPELYCDYHAEPFGVAQWKKDGVYIPVSSSKYQVHNIPHKEGNRSILFVANVESSDLGDYECEVTNKLGTEQVTVHLTFDPEIPQFEEIEPENDKVTLHWLVRSLQPLNEAMLNYKVNGTQTWTTAVPVSNPSAEKSGIWKLSHELKLLPGTYHARVKVGNTAGWSKFSHEHTFTVNEYFDNSIPEDVVYAADIGGGKLTEKKDNTNSSQATAVLSSLSILVSLLYLMVPSLRTL